MVTNYDSLGINYKGNLYKMSGKCWYGSIVVRSFHSTINGKRVQLGSTMHSEKEIDLIIK